MDSEPIPGYEEKDPPPRRRKTKPVKKHRELSKDHPLTARELLFVDNYMILRNGTQAYLKTMGKGYNYLSAMGQAHELMSKPNVRHLIECKLEDISQKYKEDLENLVANLKAWTFVDPLEMFDDDGRMLEINEMPPHVRSAIASFEVQELFEGKGEERTLAGYLKKIKFVSKEKSAELLAKYAGIDMLIRKPPEPGDPNTMTVFHTDIPFEKIRQKAEDAKAIEDKNGS